MPPPNQPVRDLPVASATYQFVDTTRSTQTESGVLVASTRTLPTTVWYPADRPGPWPLIVFGHGFQIGPAPYDRLCEKWASAGYVVASPSFPLTDQTRAGQYLDEYDMIHQPSDMSFLITQLLAVSQSGADPLAGRVDPTRVAVAGHSDGATSALAVGYYPATTDPRVKAVVALSADPFPTLDTATGTATLLDVHGDADSITPFENGSPRRRPPAAGGRRHPMDSHPRRRHHRLPRPLPGRAHRRGRDPAGPGQRPAEPGGAHRSRLNPAAIGSGGRT